MKQRKKLGSQPFPVITLKYLYSSVNSGPFCNSDQWKQSNVSSTVMVMMTWIVIHMLQT